MLEKYAHFCYNQIGNYALEYLDYFQDLRPQLTKANIGVSLPEYASMTIFTSLMVTVLGFFMLGAFFGAQSGLSGIILGISVSLILGTATVFLFFLYPAIMIRNRASKIDDYLPFATMYMSTLAGTGTSMDEIFAALAEREEYGEVAREAERIQRDIEAFGMDISEALSNAAERTPSDDFKDLMWGMNHVITTGGSVRGFLQERTEILMNDYKRRVEEFSEKLSLLIEMYITLVIIGSIIFTSMSAVMSSLGYSGTIIVVVQLLAIFVVLPLISGMLIILLEGLSPEGIR